MIRSFQTRIVLFFSALFIGVQVLTLLAIYWVCRENIVEQIGQNLVYAENIFNRLLTERGDSIASETRILVADFGFRATVSDGDAETVGSALENLTYRIRGQRGFYIDLQGNIVADTAGRYNGQPFLFPDAVAAAEINGKSVVFAMLDGELSELAVVPVLAPLPIGWVGIAIAVDRRLADNFKHLSSIPPDISLLERSANGTQVLASSLPDPSPSFFDEAVFREPMAESLHPRVIESAGDSFVVLVRPLAAARPEQAIVAVLQIDLASALRPYAMLVYALLGLSVFGLFATLLGGFLLARNIAEPVRALAGASERMIDGQFDGQFDELLPVTRSDELGRLAKTFNTASRIAAQMSDLRQQDQLRRELVASVSHDLRTPLTSLHGYLETLQLKADSLPEAERERFLAVAVRQSEKVGRLAQELFELAKLECEATRVQPETFNLMELIQDVTQKYEMAAKTRGVRLQALLDGDPPPVSADIAMIERVLTNLIDNALRHTPEGGEVRVDWFPGTERIRVAVTDSGEGIAPEYLPRLFDRDSPLSRRGRLDSGGLGLLIVAKILELHGSSIRAESTLGQGSVFSFDLAVAARAG